MAVVQARHAHDLNQGGVQKDVEKTPDCAYILNIQTTGCADGLDTVWERKRE